MAGKRIKGITVEIDGSTTGLEKALKGVDSSISSTGESLRDVNRLLKLDPTNTELLEQKQRLLANSIEDTSKRLDTLKKANEDASKSIDNYDDWKRAFDPIQEEIDQTKSHARKLREEMASMKEVGDIDTDAYKALQTELKDTNSKLRELREQAREVSDEFGNPINPKQYGSLRREIIETEQKLQSLEKESLETSAALEGDFRDAANGADSLKESVDGIGDTIKSGVFLEASEQLSGIGDKLVELGDAATESFNEVNDANTKAAAYFGETGEAAENTANVIQDVYEGGVGDSMNTVSDAVIAVKQNFQDLDQTELTNLTNQAITLEELYGIDMNETLRGASSLMKNFGMSGQEAMDFIVAGTQNGLDKTNELGDNLSEYSGKFSQAGYSAQEYFQLLNNGLDGGAYNLDKVNDAINEVTTRLADGTIADNIGIYSDKTQELFQKWQNGGATQKEVIDSIVSDIANTTNEQDALNQAAQAFGTMAEDGNLKFITSLTSVGSTYDDVSGKAQGMFEATSTPSQEMESNMRKLKDSLLPLGEQLSDLANSIIPPLAEGITAIAQGFGNLPAPVQIVLVSLAALIGGIAKIAPVITAIKALGLPAALSSIGTVITGTVLPAIGSGIAAFGSFLIPILPIIAAIGGVVAAGVLLYKNWDTIKEKAGQLKEAAAQKFGELKEAAAQKFTEMKDAVTEKVSSMKDAAAEKISSMKESITSKYQEIKQNVSESWNNMKQNMSTALSGMLATYNAHGGGLKGAVSVALTGIRGLYSTGYNAIDSLTGGKLSSVASKFTSKMSSIKSTVSGALSNVKSSFSSGMSNALSTVAGKLDSIGSKFSSIMSKAKSTVSNAISNIKSKFNFSWSLPKLKLPHLSISGKFSIAPPSVPKFGISWYKKAMDRAMVMDTPTLFGYDAKTNKLLAGGEAGREVVSGEEHLLSMIGKVVQSQYSQMGSQLEQLNSLVQQYFPQVLQNMGHDMILDDGTLVGRLAPKMDDRLSRIQRHKERGN